MDHWKSVKATAELKELLGPLYLYDDTPMLKALFQTEKECEYIESLEGVQFYKSY